MPNLVQLVYIHILVPYSCLQQFKLYQQNLLYLNSTDKLIISHCQQGAMKLSRQEHPLAAVGNIPKV